MVLATIVVLAGGLQATCRDDEPAGLRPITIADLAGSWNATSYRATSASDPQVVFELLTAGGSLTATVQANGDFAGEVSVPDPDSVQTLTLLLSGTFSPASQTTISFDFDLEVPPFLEDTTVEFTLSGSTLQLHEEGTTFGFDFDDVPKAAIFDATLVRS